MVCHLAALKELRALSLDQGSPQLFAHTCAVEYDLPSPGEGSIQRKGCQALGMGLCLFLWAQRPPQDKGKGCAASWQGLGTRVWMEVVLVARPYSVAGVLPAETFMGKEEIL